MTLTRGHLLVWLACLAAVGCGGANVDESSRQTGAEAFAAATEEFDQRSYAPAAEHFGVAIQKGGLNSDQFAEALVKRAVCWAAEGKAPEALEELDKLEANAPNLDQVFAARSFVLKKQGKPGEANAALAKARQFNRSVKEFQ